MQKDWLEDLVVRETMKLIQDDAMIDKIVQLVMDVQNQENTTIPLLEKQLREVDKKLDNLMKAIEDGLVHPDNERTSGSAGNSEG